MTAISLYTQSLSSLSIGCFISSFLCCTEIPKDGDSELTAEQWCHLSASMCHITCYGDIQQLFPAKSHMQHLSSVTRSFLHHGHYAHHHIHHFWPCGGAVHVRQVSEVTSHAHLRPQQEGPEHVSCNKYISSPVSWWKSPLSLQERE